MAAEVLAEAGQTVTIYERMPSPARKFLMAGRGGLNVTHSEPLDLFLSHYGAEASAVREAVTAFPPEKLIAWANGLARNLYGLVGDAFSRKP